MEKKTIALTVASLVLFAGCNVKPTSIQKEKCPYWCPSDNTSKPVDFDEDGCPLC